MYLIIFKQKGQKKATGKRISKEVYSYEEYADRHLPALHTSQRSYTRFDDVYDEDEPMQCYGPGCVDPARVNSKYCSDDCGLKLATT